jgi:hypothetical protein
MKLRTPLVLAAAAAALVTGLAAPASAANGDATATFTLTGGSISVSAATTTALGAQTLGSPEIVGDLDPFTVTDARGAAGHWTATATSSTFGRVTAPATGSTSTGVQYDSGVVDTGTSDTTDAATSGSVDLTAGPLPVVDAPTVSGLNTATWTPTLTVAMPTGALAGAYTGKVTMSVA